MEIKSQNLPKLSKEQLYRLVTQKDISDADREKVKSELVKREAENLYNQAQRARGTEMIPAPGGKPASGPGSQKKLAFSPAVWILIVFLVVLLAFVIYTAFIR